MTGRGRPRAFDRGAALEKAMQLFWERGYEGAAIGDLAAAMEINRPSLYAAFGCKEALFLEATALYEEREGAPLQKLLDEAPTAREGIEAHLRYNVGAYTDASHPPGCFVVLASIIGTPDNAEIRAALARSRAEGEAVILARIERGQAEGDVAASADARMIAAFYTTVTHGLSIQARDGVGRNGLDRIVDAAMAAWPALAGKP
jgi:Transcriptional regulator